MDIVHQDLPPYVRDLIAENENLKAQLRAVEDDNREPRRQHGKSFMDLALELRLLIWEFALPDRRVLRVAELPTARGTYEPGPAFFCSARPPALLHVCRESREVALTHFRPLFKKNIESGEITRPIYFRPKFDILYLDLDWYGRIASYPEVDEIESIALPHDGNKPSRVWGDGLFAGMTRLLLVAALDQPWPANRCCETVEFLPDPASKEEELEWIDYIAKARGSDDDVPNIRHVEAVVAKRVRKNWYFD
ncbi:hypothetical protein ACJZ2D_016250 [Fusarium nematophilum]